MDSGTSLRVAARFQKEAMKDNPRQEAKREVKPINTPKGIDKDIVRENGKSDTSHLDKGDAGKPASRDVRPEDVFIAKPKNTAVRSLVETGKDLTHAIKTQIPKDKGYDTVKNLSQYLVKTEGGGGTEAVGIKNASYKVEVPLPANVTAEVVQGKLVIHGLDQKGAHTLSTAFAHVVGTASSTADLGRR